MNNVMYADDICLMAPSPASLQELIDICYDFSRVGVKYSTCT